VTETSDTPLRWWETFKEGQRVPLAFLKIDRTGSTDESATLPPETVARRYRDFTAGVEWVARTYGAAQPLHWQGDGVMLFFTDVAGTSPVSAPVQAFRAARALWQRVALELNLTARIAVHCGFVPWQSDTGKLLDDTVNQCGHLEADTPSNGVGLTEDIYLLLSPEEQKDCAPLGVTKRDGIPAYIYPAPMAAKRDPAKFIADNDHEMWVAFRRYALSSEIRLLRYVGFRLTKKQPPALDIRDVFVKSTVQTTERSRLAHLPKQLGRKGKFPALRQKLAEERDELPFSPLDLESDFTSEVALDEALRQNRALVVLGDPGGGKTTLLRWLAVAAARGAYGMGLDLGIAERLLPVPVSVGRLAEIRREAGTATPVTECLARYFHARNLGAPDVLKEFLEARLKAGECLLLLDGLDEVLSDERETVHTWLETFASQYPANRWIVSSRFVGYRSFALSGGKEIALRPFSDEQVEKYISAFCRAYVQWENNGVADAAAAERAAKQLTEALAAKPRLKSLVRNPFLLSGLALIHRAVGRVPAHRIQFYEIFARCLCEAWGMARRIVAESTGGTTSELAYEGEALPILGALACRMHNDHPSGRAPRAYVIKVLASVLQEKRSVPAAESQKAAEEFLKRAADGIQIFLERGPDEWGFLHLTFQEFFCAAGLHAEEQFAKVALKHLFDPRWEEVIRLGVGYLAMVQNRPEEARRFVHKVRNYRDKARPWITDVLRLQIPLAALLAAEAEDAVPPAEQREIASELAQWVLKDLPWTDYSARILAELALTEFNVPAGEPFIAMLSYKDSEIRRKSADALGQLKAEAALEPLIAILRDKNSNVRWSVCSALGRLKIPTAVQPLLRMIKDTDINTSWSAALALGQQESSVVLQPLLRALNDENDRIRLAAVVALSQLKIVVALPSLIKALQDPSVMVRYGAVEALGKFNGEAVVQPLIACFHDDDRGVRWAAASALGHFKPESVLQLLLTSLKDSNAHTRACAARALGDLKTADAVEPLIEALNDNDTVVRRSVLYALARLKSEAAIQPLIAALRDKDLKVRWNAVESLGILINDAAFQPLLTALRDRSYLVRMDAAWALGQLQNKEALPHLILALQDKVADVRSSAAKALGLLQDEDAIPALIRALRDKINYVRSGVAQALGHFSSEVVLQPLFSALMDKDYVVCWSAAEALGELKSDESLQPLIDALLKRNDSARRLIAEALIAIAQTPPTPKKRSSCVLPPRVRTKPRKRK